MAGPVSDARAHDLRRRFFDCFDSPELPVPVEEIAEDLLGLEVARVEMGCSGMLVPSERRILVNAREPESRQRFTIAHELGHWICQCLEGSRTPIYCRAEDMALNPEARALEREANVFAAELLMPAEPVKAAFRLGTDVVFLAARHGVSIDAMGWRTFNLGLVDAHP